MINADKITAANAKRHAALQSDYDALGAQLSRRGVDIEAITAREREIIAIMDDIRAELAEGL